MNTTPRRRAFTLVELLIIIGIIGLLAAILIPTLNRATIAAQRSRCANNIRDIVRGVLSYGNDSNWNQPDPTNPYTAAQPFIRNAMPSVCPPPPAVWDWAPLKTGNIGGLWLLATGRTPTAMTAAGVKMGKGWTSLDVMVCPEAVGQRKVRTPVFSDGGFLPETASYGYVSQVPFNVPAHVETRQGGSFNVAQVTYTANSVTDSPSGLVIVADGNPRRKPGDPPGLDTNSKPMNSLNHRKEGQNLGTLDGGVKWSDTSVMTKNSSGAVVDDLYLPNTLTVENSTPAVPAPAPPVQEGRRSLPSDNLILY